MMWQTHHGFRGFHAHSTSVSPKRTNQCFLSLNPLKDCFFIFEFKTISLNITMSSIAIIGNIQQLRNDVLTSMYVVNHIAKEASLLFGSEVVKVNGFLLYTFDAAIRPYFTKCLHVRVLPANRYITIRSAGS